MNAQQYFEKIRDVLCSQHEEIHEGSMMSSPGIQYKGKNFAFSTRSKSVTVRSCNCRTKMPVIKHTLAHLATDHTHSYQRR